MKTININKDLITQSRLFNYLIALAEDKVDEIYDPESLEKAIRWSPTTDESQAYEIIIRERIATSPVADTMWQATSRAHQEYYCVDKSLLRAALRLYLLSKFGEWVRIPEAHYEILTK